MDGDTDGDGAINLSTSQRPSAANTPNGSIEYEDSGQVSIIYMSQVIIKVVLSFERFVIKARERKGIQSLVFTRCVYECICKCMYTRATRGYLSVSLLL